jgi:hypothetical protein
MMGKRDGWNEEQRSKERDANKLRMRRAMADPLYRAAANERRKKRDAERKATDPDLRKRLNEYSAAYVERNKHTDDFKAKRAAELKRWRNKNRLELEADLALAALEQEV